MSAQTVLHASARAHGSAGPPGSGPAVPVLGVDHIPGPASCRAFDGGDRRVGLRATAPAPVPCHGD